MTRGVAAVALACVALAAAAATQALEAGDGQRLYRDGLAIASGAPLVGQREQGGPVEGQAAACVSCHRRSGLGAREGDTIIPPIQAPFLFRARELRSRERELDGPDDAARRAPYDDVSLAQAIRTGVAPGGHRLSYLMPRYALDDDSMTALIGYLRRLGADATPGVSDTSLDFATVVDDAADPKAADGMLAVLERFFATQNRVIAPEVRPMKAQRSLMYRVTRVWHLHVWHLHGPPQTHAAQLAAYYRETPVYALLSGLPGRSADSVQAFCESEHVPCLFPNADLPVVERTNDYTMYFSGGVRLEAALIGHALAAEAPAGPRRLWQAYRPDTAGNAAAAALAQQMASLGWSAERVALDGDGRAALRKLATAGANDAVVLWLSPADLERLPATAPAASVYVSGLTAGLEHAPLPGAWRAQALMTYPFDPPALRSVRMTYPLAWFHAENLAVTDEHVQADTYIACQILAETLKHMLDHFDREYLIERIESMLSLRLVTGYYPRLSLGPGQRYASKGGYLVRLGADGSVAPATEWLTP